jgi:hypothetical protein
MLGTFGKTTSGAGTCCNKSTVQTQFPKGGCLTGTDRVAAAILARSGMNLVDVMSKAGNSFQTCTGLASEMNRTTRMRLCQEQVGAVPMVVRARNKLALLLMVDKTPGTHTRDSPVSSAYFIHSCNRAALLSTRHGQSKIFQRVLGRG